MVQQKRLPCEKQQGLVMLEMMSAMQNQKQQKRAQDEQAGGGGEKEATLQPEGVHRNEGLEFRSQSPSTIKSP